MNTVILFWNPAVSSYTLDRFKNDLVNLDDTYNWSVWEHEKASYGDRFYLVRCGEGKTGICMSGRFSSDPYKDEDWSGRGREIYYMDMLPDYIVDSEVNPILSTKELQQAIPDFNWAGGHSGRILSPEQAVILEKLWDKYLESHQNLFKLTAIYRADNVLRYPSLVNMGFKKETNEAREAYIEFQGDGSVSIKLMDEDLECTMNGKTLSEMKDAFQQKVHHQFGPGDIHYEYDGISHEKKNQDLYEKALELCLVKHAGQVDKEGKPYLGHIARVAGEFYDECAVIGLLHDIVEDTDVTPDELLQKGFTKEIVDAVVAITRKEDESYETYIERVGKNELARKVKMADLEDNMNIRRLPQITEDDLARLNNYVNAWRHLTSLYEKEC